MINIIIKLFYIITLFFLVSCGFVLQSTIINSEFINEYGLNVEMTKPNSLLSAEINRTIEYFLLRRSNSEDAIRLQILEDEVSETIFSISAQNTPIEYEISYRVSYQIFLGENEIIEPQEVVRSRIYSFELDNILGKQRESMQIQREIASEVTSQIFRHF